MPTVPGIIDLPHLHDSIHDLSVRLASLAAPTDPLSAVRLAAQIDTLGTQLIARISDFRILAHLELSRIDPFFDTLKGPSTNGTQKQAL